MDNDSKQSSGMSGRIEDLIVDLGNERFMTRNEALNNLKEMLPAHERAISAELVRWVQLYGKSDVGSSASFVNKAAMDLFQNMTEMGLEPLINDGLKDGDFFARRTVMDAIGRTGRMSVLPYLILGMDEMVNKVLSGIPSEAEKEHVSKIFKSPQFSKAIKVKSTETWSLMVGEWVGLQLTKSKPKSISYKIPMGNIKIPTKAT